MLDLNIPGLTKRKLYKKDQIRQVIKLS